MYPRTYRVKVSLIVTIATVMLVSIGTLVAVGVSSYRQGSIESTAQIAQFAAWTVALALPLALPLAILLGWRVVLEEDRITAHYLVGAPRVMARIDILGKRCTPYRGETTTRLLARDPGTRPFKVNTVLKMDEVFEEWLASIPEIDR
jgi:hypothetical protein